MSEPDNYNRIITDNVSLLPEPIRPRPWYQRWGRRLAATLFILAMLFLGGLYQFGLFQKTSPDTSVSQYEALIDEPVQSLPATIFVLSTAPSTNTSRARLVTEKANALLAQAAVKLDPVQVKVVTVADDVAARQLVANPERLQSALPSLQPNRLHVVMTSGLGGINGIAFPGRQVVAVAEYTTSFDFRVLAHEVGHILSLDHVTDKENLMYSGSSGTKMTTQQARKAYEAAADFLPKS